MSATETVLVSVGADDRDDRRERQEKFDAHSAKVGILLADLDAVRRRIDYILSDDPQVIQEFDRCVEWYVRQMECLDTFLANFRQAFDTDRMETVGEHAADVGRLGNGVRLPARDVFRWSLADLADAAHGLNRWSRATLTVYDESGRAAEFTTVTVGDFVDDEPAGPDPDPDACPRATVRLYADDAYGPGRWTRAEFVVEFEGQPAVTVVATPDPAERAEDEKFRFRRDKLHCQRG